MNIFESINAVMDEIGAIGKTSKNTTQGFMFRGIDAVMNAINPALIKYKVFIVPEILEQLREERTNTKGTTLIYSVCKVKYTFYAEDGSHIEATVIGEGMDTGDKATNKAMSVAFKYACFQVFCIPTEEMEDDDASIEDPDKESHKVKATQGPVKQLATKEPVKQLTAPSRTELLDFTNKKYPKGSKPLKQLLEMWKIEKTEDATDAQLIAIWDHYHGPNRNN